MYTEQVSIPIKSSASLLYNNFDVLQSTNEKEILFNVVHKSNVWVFNPEEVQHNHNAYKKVVLKGEISQNSSMLFQAKWVRVQKNILLVVTSVKGVQIFDSTGSVMMFWSSIQSNKDDSKGQFGRGVTAVDGHYICVGTGDGKILVFDVPVPNSDIKLEKTLEAHDCSITDLHSVMDSGRMVSSDDVGKIIVWDTANASFTKVKTIEGYGFPCSSVRMCNNNIIAGYGSGHIRLFDIESGMEKIKIEAHAKWINAIDVTSDGEMLLSASEDTYVRVWRLQEFGLVYQKSVTDVQLTGGRFLDQNGNTFGVTGYDSSEVFIFQRT